MRYPLISIISNHVHQIPFQSSNSSNENCTTLSGQKKSKKIPQILLTTTSPTFQESKGLWSRSWAWNRLRSQGTSFKVVSSSTWLDKKKHGKNPGKILKFAHKMCTLMDWGCSIRMAYTKQIQLGVLFGWMQQCQPNKMYIIIFKSDLRWCLRKHPEKWLTRRFMYIIYFI